MTQKQNALAFKNLHHSKDILVLPNIWDPLGAALLESLDYPAIATASASVALTNGYPDGEHIPFDVVLSRLSSIVKIVSVPVTADIESGYASTEGELQKNIEKLITTGIVGINLEDHDKGQNTLYPLQTQCRRIQTVRKVAETMDVPLFINARTDVYLRGENFDTPEKKLQETLRRGKAFLDAGADGFFPVAVKSKQELSAIVSTLRCPVNVIAFPGIPDFKTMREIGIARVSLGPGFLKIAVNAMKQLASRLKRFDGLDDVINNDVTSEDLKKLINRSGPS
jgi:2-methylisocitrate lyase-like PEP mutase family enzyme